MRSSRDAVSSALASAPVYGCKQSQHIYEGGNDRCRGGTAREGWTRRCYWGMLLLFPNHSLSMMFSCVALTGACTSAGQIRARGHSARAGSKCWCSQRGCGGPKQFVCLREVGCFLYGLCQLLTKRRSRFPLAGVALVEVSKAHGMRVVANLEEERFTGKKHCPDHPIQSLREVRTGSYTDYSLPISILLFATLIICIFIGSPLDTRYMHGFDSKASKPRRRSIFTLALG